jgi:cytochrome c553
MESAVITSRHVECVDCHNPHANKDGPGTPPGALTAVRGVAISYGSVFGSEALPSARYEYEVCFRCHGDSQPSTLVARQVVSTNIRQKFDRSNPSLHPVGAVGRSSNVPSLIPPWTTSSLIGCGDCHNNNAGPNSTTPPGSGTGPNGPHGSTFAPLLERNYVRTDNTPESAARYALCYKCHDRGFLYANNNRNQPFGGINGHLRHLGPDINSPCSACHDPHGVYGTPPGTNVPANYARLINFDTTIVLPTTGGKLPQWIQTSPNNGMCYLRCHNHNHNPETYP